MVILLFHISVKFQLFHFITVHKPKHSHDMLYILLCHHKLYKILKKILHLHLK